MYCGEGGALLLLKSVPAGAAVKSDGVCGGVTLKIKRFAGLMRAETIKRWIDGIRRDGSALMCRLQF